MDHHPLLSIEASMPLSSFFSKIRSASPSALLQPLSGYRNRNSKRAYQLFLSSKMYTDSSPLTHSITLPIQPAEPVQIVASPGISHADFWNAIDSSLFKKWLSNLQSQNGVLTNGSLALRRVLIQGVDMFGKRIGFLKFKADIFDKETGQKCQSMIRFQVRVPVGRIILQLPAGMLDDDKGDFVGTAVREVEEETGMRLKMEHMVDLTAFLDSSTGCRVFPSAGGCDEEISIFLYRGSVDKEIITELQGKEAGLHDHGELIRVRIVPYKKLWCSTADAQVLTAIALYEMAMKEGLLPPLNAALA